MSGRNGANLSNWWVPSQPSSNTPGSATYGGGGYGNSYKSDVVQYRSSLDAARAGHGQIGQAAYPDGYLGNLSWDRQQDKMMDAVERNLNKKSYQRGVHKGEKIEASDYFWPDGEGPMRGIQREARYEVTTDRRNGYRTSLMSVKRYAPTGNPVERLAHLGKLGGATPPQQQRLYEQYGVSVAKNPIVISDPKVKPYIDRMKPLTSW